MKQCNSTPAQLSREAKKVVHYAGHFFEKQDAAAQLQCHYCKMSVPSAELKAMDAASKAVKVKELEEENKGREVREREFVDKWCIATGHVLLSVSAHDALQDELLNLRANIERAAAEKIVLEKK